MKEKILELRSKGKTYKQIADLIGCAKSSVAYHCGIGQKQKSLERQRKRRKTSKGIFRKKLSVFLRYKVKTFKRGYSKNSFDYATAYNKISKAPICYLTGDNIVLENTSSYELDHIIPVSKGGKNTLKNMGVTTKEANRAKDSMLLGDFISLCKKVCENNGYKVIPENGNIAQVG